MTDQTIDRPRDSLGDYIKSLEATETQRGPIRGQAVYIRLDGVGFSKFTHFMGKPYDMRMSRAMAQTAVELMRQYEAILAYTQSDEISLVLYPNPDNPLSEFIYGGRLQKLVSRTAATATRIFTDRANDNDLYEYTERRPPEFDSRAFVCSIEDAAKAIYWREIDARKNAIQGAAQKVYSHKQLFKKHADDQIEMLAAKGIDFEKDYPDFFKRGAYFRLIKRTRSLTAFELAKIPIKHRKASYDAVERQDIEQVLMPSLRNDSAEERASILFFEPPVLVSSPQQRIIPMTAA